MSSAFDSRVISVGIVLPDRTHTFSGDYHITATGTKFGCATMNSCNLRIDNLTKELRNTILTLASPLLGAPANNPAYANSQNPNRAPVVLTLDVGRQSTGTFQLFKGDVFSCEMVQPPDIGIMLRSLTNNYQTSLLANIQQPATTLLSEIAQTIAIQNGKFLDFEATDKNIDNYSFTGSNQGNIDKLNQMGNIQAGIDNDTLWVIDSGATRRNTGFLINEANGMVGIPQVTSEGVVAKVMINSAILIGGEVTIDSVMNPAANGTFKVAKIDYEVASREPPFWYTLLCSNIGLFQGSV